MCNNHSLPVWDFAGEGKWKAQCQACPAVVTKSATYPVHFVFRRTDGSVYGLHTLCYFHPEEQEEKVIEVYGVANNFDGFYTEDLEPSDFEVEPEEATDTLIGVQRERIEWTN